MPPTPTRRSSAIAGRGSAALGVVCGFFGATLVWTAIVAPPAAARDLSLPMGRPATERHHFQGDPFARAGNPQCLSRVARPTESPHETGYFVGGGARTGAPRGEPRRVADGVWGTDFTGILFPKHVELGWWHGQRFQGGGLGYRTTGPRVLPRR